MKVSIPAREYAVDLDFVPAPGRDREWPGSYLKFTGKITLESRGLIPVLAGHVELQEWNPKLDQPGNDHTTFAKDIDEKLELPPNTDLSRARKLSFPSVAAPDAVTVVRDFHVYHLPAGKKDEYDNATANGVVSHWKYDGDTKKVYFSTPEYTLQVVRERTLLEYVKLFLLRYIGVKV